ncbi:MAG: cysteine protease ATG4, partial [bacterium]
VTAVDGESCLQIDGASTRAEDASSASPACVGLQAPPEMPASYINSFRCHRPLFTPLKSLDPSLAIALHCRNRKEFDELCVELQTAFSSETTPPLFSVSAVEPVYE